MAVYHPVKNDVNLPFQILPTTSVHSDMAKIKQTQFDKPTMHLNGYVRKDTHYILYQGKEIINTLGPGLDLILAHCLSQV